MAGVPDRFVLHRGIARMIEVKAKDDVLPMRSARPRLRCWRLVGTLVSRGMLRRRWRAWMYGPYPRARAAVRE